MNYSGKLIKRRVSPAASQSGVPEYPGQELGMTYEQYQQFILNSVRVKGFAIAVTGGVAGQLEPLNISGDARMMLGISAHALEQWNNDANLPRTLSLMINEEAAFTDWNYATIDKKYNTSQPFIPFKRPLTGKDDVTLSINSVGAPAQTIFFNIHYI